MRPAIRASQRFIICVEEIASKHIVKYLPHILITLLIAIQYPLWIGKGSWLRVWDMSKQVDQQKEKNTTLASRNAGLDAEVRDLKQGIDAVEERARVEFGMVKSDETFYQIIEKSKPKL
jgi:cell division protein FtsB